MQTKKRFCLTFIAVLIIQPLYLIGGPGKLYAQQKTFTQTLEWIDDEDAFE